jgi:hypothetical protein
MSKEPPAQGFLFNFLISKISQNLPKLLDFTLESFPNCFVKKTTKVVKKKKTMQVMMTISVMIAANNTHFIVFPCHKSLYDPAQQTKLVMQSAHNLSHLANHLTLKSTSNKKIPLDTHSANLDAPQLLLICCWMSPHLHQFLTAS